ncbi:unnamed protein product, partial [Cuscuta epithymum]
MVDKWVPKHRMNNPVLQNTVQLITNGKPATQYITDKGKEKVNGICTASTSKDVRKEESDSDIEEVFTEQAPQAIPAIQEDLQSVKRDLDIFNNLQIKLIPEDKRAMDDYNLQKLIQRESYDPALCAKGYSSDGDLCFLENIQKWEEGQSTLSKKVAKVINTSKHPNNDNFEDLLAGLNSSFNEEGFIR